MRDCMAFAAAVIGISKFNINAISISYINNCQKRRGSDLCTVVTRNCTSKYTSMYTLVTRCILLVKAILNDLFLL